MQPWHDVSDAFAPARVKAPEPPHPPSRQAQWRAHNTQSPPNIEYHIAVVQLRLEQQAFDVGYILFDSKSCHQTKKELAISALVTSSTHHYSALVERKFDHRLKTFTVDQKNKKGLSVNVVVTPSTHHHATLAQRLSDHCLRRSQ